MSSSAGAAAARNTSIDVSAKVELPQPRTSSLRGGPHNHIPTINIHECVTLPPFPGTSCLFDLKSRGLGHGFKANCLQLLCSKSLYMDSAYVGLTSSANPKHTKSGFRVERVRGFGLVFFSTLLPPAPLQQALYMDGGLGVQVQGSKGLWFGVFSTLLPPALLQQSP
eukprot:1161263-Pelagomonas_calceolata.AAC.27